MSPDPRLINMRDLPTTGSEFNRRSRLLPDVVRIDRRSRWGNPFVIGDEVWPESNPDIRIKVDRDFAIVLYRMWLTAKLDAEPTFLDPLRGRRLACWCAPEPCHGDVILAALDAMERP